MRKAEKVWVIQDSEWSKRVKGLGVAKKGKWEVLYIRDSRLLDSSLCARVLVIEASLGNWKVVKLQSSLWKESFANFLVSTPRMVSQQENTASRHAVHASSSLFKTVSISPIFADFLSTIFAPQRNPGKHAVAKETSVAFHFTEGNNNGNAGATQDSFSTSSRGGRGSRNEKKSHRDSGAHAVQPSVTFLANLHPGMWVLLPRLLRVQLGDGVKRALGWVIRRGWGWKKMRIQTSPAQQPPCAVNGISLGGRRKPNRVDISITALNPCVSLLEGNRCRHCTLRRPIRSKELHTSNFCKPSPPNKEQGEGEREKMKNAKMEKMARRGIWGEWGREKLHFCLLEAHFFID